MPDMDTATLEALLAEVTPGEWRAEYDVRTWGWADVVADGFKVGWPTKAIGLTHADYIQLRANARLIAMAPDLARTVIAQAAQIEALRAEVSAWKTAFWTADNFAVAIHDADGKCYSVRAQDYQRMDELFHGRAALQSEVSHG